MEAIVSIHPPAEARSEADQRTHDDEEDSWLMAANHSDRADRIEQKLDRLTIVLNELHRDMGEALARDARQEKDFDLLRQSQHAGRAEFRTEFGKDIDGLEQKVTSLQREHDKSTSGLQAKVQILLWVAAALATAVFGLLVNLVAQKFGS